MDNIFHKSLRALLEYSNAHYNDNTFLSFIGGEGYTYGQFYVKACGTARLLFQYGMRQGSLVGLLSQNMPNWGVAYFATAAFGMITVPMLPDFSESEIKHILKHSETKESHGQT